MFITVTLVVRPWSSLMTAGLFGDTLLSAATEDTAQRVYEAVGGEAGGFRLCDSGRAVRCSSAGRVVQTFWVRSAGKDGWDRLVQIPRPERPTSSHISVLYRHPVQHLGGSAGTAVTRIERVWKFLIVLFG